MLCIPRFCLDLHVPVVLVIIFMAKILSNIILIPIVFLCEISSMHLTHAFHLLLTKVDLLSQGRAAKLVLHVTQVNSVLKTNMIRSFCLVVAYAILGKRACV